MGAEPDLALWVIVWSVAVVLTLVRHWRTDWGAGLLLTYVISFATLHWLVPLLGLLPWYEGDTQLTAEGLRLSAIAMLAFWGGSEIVTLVRGRRRLTLADIRQPQSRLAPALVTAYLVAGAVLYGGIMPVAGRLPTIAAIVSTGATLMAVGVGMKCWNAWQERANLRLVLWLASTAAFPLITVVTQGFLGYGFAATLLVAAFVASFHRPHFKEIAIGLLAAYLGLSIYVTYMRDRQDIRAAVWGGASLSDRFDALGATVKEFEWFNPYDINHLRRLSLRLDQDHLIGAAVVNLRENFVQFGDGETLWDAALALIPRAVWANKPIVGGSGDIVSRYTGFRFAEGTSVGAGQVLEFYVNFGTAGVVIGFACLGLLVTYIDRVSAAILLQGDTRRFVMWYLPGLSLLQVGGSMAEIVATAGASFVLALALSRLTLPLPEAPIDRHDPADADTEVLS
jgi:hypothetical protein